MTASQKRLPKGQKELAKKVLAQLEHVQAMMWDPETPPRKLAEIERVLRRCHALYFRGRR